MGPSSCRHKIFRRNSLLFSLSLSINFGARKMTSLSSLVATPDPKSAPLVVRIARSLAKGVDTGRGRALKAVMQATTVITEPIN